MEQKKAHYYEAPNQGHSAGSNPPPYYTVPAPGPGPSPCPPGPQGQTVVHTIPATVIMQPQMGPQSTRTNCRSCNHEISTRVECDASSKTHLMALVLCLLGCWCCCCIPYCVDSCMTANHYCPNCNAFLGSYQS